MAEPDPYDALLLVSFGGPEAPAEVMPFLERVTAGRGIPTERLAEVAEHYQHFGGRSPINDQNRALIAAVEKELAARGLDLPVYWGNRNSAPYFPDALRRMHEDGVTRAAMFVTSAYSSYSGCRQYRENLGAAVLEVPDAPLLDRTRHYFNHPGFVTANADALVQAYGRLPAGLRERAPVAYVTHSVPTAMDEVSGPQGHAYVQQHLATAQAVTEQAARELGFEPQWELVYCSRSGSPRTPWLEPDVNDHLRELHAREVPAVVVAPIGFVSDHMEVAFDLDTEAAATAHELGLPYVRAATAGTHPALVAAVVDLVLERALAARGEVPYAPTVGDQAPSHYLCPVGCCRNLRQDLPTVGGQDDVQRR